MKHNCPRCNYSTDATQKYIRHLNRKNVCKAINSDVSLKIERNKFIKKDNKQQNLQCNICNKTLSSVQALKKHVINCKKKQEDKQSKKETIKKVENKHIYELLIKQTEQMDKQTEQINKLKEEIRCIKSKSDTTTHTNSHNTNTTNNINIDNSINLVSYGDTENNVLSNKEILSCMKYSMNCIPYLIQKIHFHKKRPENINILIKHEDAKFINLFDGQRWIIRRKQEVITDLINNKHAFLEDKITEWTHDNKYNEEIEKYSRFRDAHLNNEELEELLEENVMIVLCNNRHIVKDNTNNEL